LAARRRRASSASKSRFTPRGLPMPAKLYQTLAYVNYIMRDSIVRVPAHKPAGNQITFPELGDSGQQNSRL